MNLIILTPATEKSAIGRMAALVTRQLVAQGCQVCVVRTENNETITSQTHDFGTTIVRWDDEAQVRSLLQGADAAVYQIGDNFDYHAGAVRWLADFPGLVCLHDFFVASLFYGWLHSHRMQGEAVLARWYGQDLARRFFSYSDSTSFIEGTREVMPLTEWICGQADGVITHSRWGCDRVLKSCSGPVRVVPLAYDAPRTIAHEAPDPHRGEQSLQLLTIGHVNPNKRIANVIEAIGRSPLLKTTVAYRSVGYVQPEIKHALSDLADRMAVPLTISGEVDATKLELAIQQSDVISCLRWPVLEAASASAIESMLYGKAIIVTNAGFYQEIPDSVVAKIDPHNEVNEIQSVLEGFVQDRQRVRQLGQSAQKWAARTFSAVNYAEQIIDVVKEITRTLPVKRAVERYSDTLRRWSASTQRLSTPELIDALKLFERNPDSPIKHK